MTWLVALSMLRRVTLVLSCRSLKFLPPLPISQPICSGSTGSLAVTNSSFSRAASTDCWVGPMITTRGPFWSISTTSTPVSRLASAIFLPPLPTTRPMSSLSIANSMRTPVSRLDFSVSSRSASFSRCECTDSSSEKCFFCNSINIFAISMDFCEPMSLSCGFVFSTTTESSCAFSRILPTSSCSFWRKRAWMLRSLIGIVCLQYIGLPVIVLVAGRMLSSSMASSGKLPHRKCTLQ
mmetsp:Transcript_20877/g.42382  ORF Transcript_20877/g.42382 Transcript_20877/m.42382 type:complete len:237 (+) Transcript_20877:572-1282(+)